MDTSELRERLEREANIVMVDEWGDTRARHRWMASALLGVLEMHLEPGSPFCPFCRTSRFPCETVRLILERMGGAK